MLVGMETLSVDENNYLPNVIPENYETTLITSSNHESVREGSVDVLKDIEIGLASSVNDGLNNSDQTGASGIVGTACDDPTSAGNVAGSDVRNMGHLLATTTTRDALMRKVDDDDNGLEQLFALELPRESPTLCLVPNCCAICLEPYCVGEAVVWSCNPDCPHAFHQECILDYLVPKQHRQDEQRAKMVAPCPCCRREFLENPMATGE